VICVGYDMVEYHPEMWNPNGDKTIVHIDALPPRSTRITSWRWRPGRHHFEPAGHRVESETAEEARRSRRCARRSSTTARATPPTTASGQAAENRVDLREVLAPEDIAISDVGAHKMWMARMYRAERPNTCVISNGFAAMGIAVRGDRRQARVPRAQDRRGHRDAGFMMNSQEIETALRMKTPFVVLIWNDAEYGLITWHQLRHFGRPSNISFKEPRLRQIRGELRRERLSRRAHSGISSPRSRKRSRRHGRHHRLSGRLFGKT